MANSSRSYGDHLFSCGVNFLLMYAITWRLPFCICSKAPPMAKPEASVVTKKGLFMSGTARTGVVVRASFNASKALRCSSFHNVVKSTSFRWLACMSVKGLPIAASLHVFSIVVHQTHELLHRLVLRPFLHRLNFLRIRGYCWSSIALKNWFLPANTESKRLLGVRARVPF